ncbi:MAG: GNAT family N-acetyltransferase [Lewinella sp.]
MLKLRPIGPEDNEAVAAVIRTVMTEFSCVGEGYSINDPELGNMHAAYSPPGSAFYALTKEGNIVGVGGFAPLAHSDGTVCELRKMYLLPTARGSGGGRMLLHRCLDEARKDGYERMYLETVRAMTTAATMYARYGFTPLDGPLGKTGHTGCDRYMIRHL